MSNERCLEAPWSLVERTEEVTPPPVKTEAPEASEETSLYHPLGITLIERSDSEVFKGTFWWNTNDPEITLERISIAKQLGYDD